LLREAVEINRRLLGEQHEQVAQGLAHLAFLYYVWDRYEDSARAYRAALEQRREFLGDEHLLVIESMALLGVALHAGDDADSAVPLLREAIEGYRNLGADDIPAAMDVKRDLACTLTDLHRLDEAEPLAREVLEKTETLFGAQHWRTAASIQTLGWLLVRKGHPSQAEPMLRKCIEIFRRLYLPDHLKWMLAQVNSALGECLTAQGQFEDAEPLLLESYREIHTAKGSAYVVTRMALERVIALYEAWGRPKEVARWRAAGKGLPTVLEAEQQPSRPDA
jgi:tetratricopeptide (TPR) repeat protein